MADFRKSGKRGGKPFGRTGTAVRRRGVQPQELALGSLTIVTPAEDVDQGAELLTV